MIKIVILSALFVAVYCAPPKEFVPIVSQEGNVEPDGHFHYSYESADGSKIVQDGEPKVVDKDHQAETVVGSYTYTGDDGKTYHVEYTADEHGFVAHGDHIPAIPETIARAIKWAEEHPFKEVEKH